MLRKREVKGAEEANVKLEALYRCLAYRQALVLFQLAFVDRIAFVLSLVRLAPPPIDGRSRSQHQLTQSINCNQVLSMGCSNSVELGWRRS
jgi:hypothetical protein